MALIDQQIPISFAKGLNTKSDPKQIMPGEMLSLQNATFISPQEFTSANGYAARNTTIYNSSNNIASGNSLGKFADLITLNDGKHQYSYSETAQKWIDKGIKLATSVSSTTIDTGGAQSISPAQITGVRVLKAANGYECYYYNYNPNLDGSDFSLVQLVVFDPLIGEIVYSNASSSYSMTAAIQGNVIYFYSISSYVSIDVTSPTTTTSGSFGPFSEIFDLQQVTSSIYVLGIVSGNLVLNEYTSPNTLVSSVTINASTAASLGSLVNDTFNSRWIVGWSDGLLSNNYAIYSYSLALIQASTALTFTGNIPVGAFAISGGPYSASESALYFEIQPNIPFSSIQTSVNNRLVVQFNIVGTTATQGQSWYNVSLASNALPDGNGFQYITFGHFLSDQGENVISTVPMTIQPNYFIIYTNPTQYSIVGKFGEDTAPNIAISNLSNLIQLDANDILFPYMQSNGEGIDYPVVSTTPALTQINVYNACRGILTIGTKLTSIYLGNNQNIIGGQSSIYDNVGVAEAGFNLFPEVTAAIASTAEGSVFVPPGTYSYSAIYQWFDAQGNKHRSAPSPGIEVIQENTHGSNVVYVAGLSMSEEYKVNNIQILLYRNAPTINATTYFLVSVQSNNPKGNVQFSDIIPDADIINAEQLYTTGGEVENIAPPSFLSTTAYKNRIIGVQADNPYIWWYSKQQIEYFPIEFSDLFTQSIDGSKGPIHAVNMLDDKIIFFCESGIFYVLGDGPSPNGTNNDFTYPQIITADTSCNNPNSMVILPIGIMFASPKGIYLLDRSLQVSYIGAPVEQFNDQDIVSATLIPTTTQVRFAFQNGSALLYDYFVQQWSALPEITAVDATTYENSYTYLQSNGLVLEEIPNTFVNNGNPVAMSFQTGWFSFSNLQGFQRIKQLLLLLTSQNATSIKVDFAYNYDSTVQDTRIIPINASTIPQQFRIFPVTQKAESMQITLTEIPTGATGGGMTLSGLMFTYGAKKGSYKVTAAQSYG